jgi:hypothetical protein
MWVLKAIKLLTIITRITGIAKQMAIAPRIIRTRLQMSLRGGMVAVAIVVGGKNGSPMVTGCQHP